jgi:hypothetical protein
VLVNERRALRVPHLDLDAAALRDLAAHFDELSAKAKEKIRSQAAAGYHFGKTGDDLTKAIEDEVERSRYSWSPTFGVTMERGSLDDGVWEDLWTRANYPDIRVITMSARSATGEAKVRLATTGFSSDSSSSEITISSDDPAEMQREIGFFSGFFERHSAGFRERLRLTSVLGAILWIILPTAAITTLVMRFFFTVVPVTSSASSQGAAIGVFLWVVAIVGTTAAVLSNVLLSRLSPRVLVSGVGPLAWLRPHAVALAVGILAASIVSLAFLLVAPPH